MRGAPYLIPLLEKTEQAMTISGVISNHHHARYDRNNILFFVNKRLVKNQPLTRALLKGYAHALPPGRFPATCIFIAVDPKTIDVNIHPRKEEVQFLHPRIIEVALEKTVKQTLEQHLAQQVHRGPDTITSYSARANYASESTIIPAHLGVLHGHEYPELFSASPFAEQETATQSMPQNSATAYTHKPHYGTQESDTAQKAQPNIEFTHTFAQPAHEEPTAHIQRTQCHTHETACTHTHTESSDQAQQASAFAYTPERATENNYTLIGQLHKTYLLLEKHDGLYVVDQHAAHERILYELFRTRFDETATVTLMFPQIITLTHEAIQAISPYLPLYQSLGVSLDALSDYQLALTATPVYLKNVNFQELIENTLSWIAEFEQLEKEEISKTLTEKIHAQMACKAAVKAGDELTREQMIRLLDDLEKTANNFTCPHGRPTGWLLSSYEIEKKFKRKL